MDISFETVLVSTFMAWAIVGVMMLLLWGAEVKYKNAAFVDVGWCVGLFLVVLTHALMFKIFGLRQVLVLVCVGAWALRLAVHLLKRILKESSEDRRYQQIRANWKTHVHAKFFFFFQFQAFLDVALGIVFVPLLINTHPMGILEFAAVFIWVIGFVGEAIADEQLKQFKGNPLNKGKTCQVGLWQYSRHPNYFFEWLMWASYALWALCSPWGWVGIWVPGLMYFFLMHLSGVPLAEAQSLASKGEEYRRYQLSTSVFVPWFKKGEK